MHYGIEWGERQRVFPQDFPSFLWEYSLSFPRSNTIMHCNNFNSNIVYCTFITSFHVEIRVNNILKNMRNWWNSNPWSLLFRVFFVQLPHTRLYTPYIRTFTILRKHGFGWKRNLRTKHQFESKLSFSKIRLGSCFTTHKIPKSVFYSGIKYKCWIGVFDCMVSQTKNKLLVIYIYVTF